MNTPRRGYSSPWPTWLVASVCALGLSGCASGLLPKPPAPAVLLALDASAWTPMPPMYNPLNPSSLRSLSVEQARAAPGYDTREMAYTRRAHEVEYFAQHQWLDTPAAMLSPLLVRALRDSGRFSAVTPASSTALADLRLETEWVRLEQNFLTQPSQMHVVLRVTLLEIASGRVLGWREFDARAATQSDDAFGGAAAANLLVQQMLPQVAAFCAELARQSFKEVAPTGAPPTP